MEYIKGNAFFATEGKSIKYDYLDADLTCDVLIIGGGIDGAIANYYLSGKYDTVLVDKGRVAMGCTSCATPLCEYQLDDFAHQLTKHMSLDEVDSVYRMGLESIDKLQSIVDKIGNNCHFTRCPTLLYTDKVFGAKDIEREYDWRRSRGYSCTLVDEGNNAMPFIFKRGLYCPDGGCTFNGVLLARQLLANSSNGKNIYQHTKIDKVESGTNGYIAYTNYGNKISCNKVVIATAFNWELTGRNDLCNRFITYTIVTEPVEGLVWHNNTLCQDSGDPYHYFRVTHDNRIVFGGEDTAYSGDIDSNLAEKKYDKLEKQLRSMLPFGEQLVIASRFCGAFGSTNNNLGVIGEDDNGLYYFFSCGANGIVNAVYGAELLDDLFNNRHNDMLELLSPKRKII